MMHLYRTLLFSLILISCNAFADDYDKERFVAACLSFSNMGEPICECLSSQAQQDLSPEGFAFLVATLEKDEETTKELREKTPLQDITSAGMFMVSAPASCT